MSTNFSSRIGGSFSGQHPSQIQQRPHHKRANTAPLPQLSEIQKLASKDVSPRKESLSQHSTHSEQLNTPQQEVSDVVSTKPRMSISMVSKVVNTMQQVEDSLTTDNTPTTQQTVLHLPGSKRASISRSKTTMDINSKGQLRVKDFTFDDHVQAIKKRFKPVHAPVTRSVKQRIGDFFSGKKHHMVHPGIDRFFKSPSQLFAAFSSPFATDRDKLVWNSFKVHCKSEFSSENPMFMEMGHELTQIDPKKEPAKFFGLLKSIGDKMILEGSDLQVNVSHKNRSRFKIAYEAFYKNGIDTPEVRKDLIGAFSDCQEDVMRLMNDSFSRFKRQNRLGPISRELKKTQTQIIEQRNIRATDRFMNGQTANFFKYNWSEFGSMMKAGTKEFVNAITFGKLHKIRPSFKVWTSEQIDLHNANIPKYNMLQSAKADTELVKDIFTRRIGDTAGRTFFDAIDQLTSN